MNLKGDVMVAALTAVTVYAMLALNVQNSLSGLGAFAIPVLAGISVIVGGYVGRMLKL